MAVSPPAPPRDAASERLRGRLMAQSLQAVLDRVRGAREVLPHLAALESGLLQHGLDAIGRIPPHWLPKICTQLSSLPLPEQDPALQDLLDRLMATLKDNQRPATGSGDFDPERTVVIREISHSDFMAASNEMATTINDNG
jgi:hypothetical protein